MKKFTKALILMLAALMLFASCAPEPDPEPKPDPKPDPTPEVVVKPPKDRKAEDGSWTMNYHVDPEHPYDTTHFGLFHDQKTASGATYSIYIPEGFQPKNQAMIVLIPGKTTAEDWFASEAGKAWIEHSKAKKNFAVVAAAPATMEKKDGTVMALDWNTSLEEGSMYVQKRNDVDYILDIFSAIRKKDWVDGGNAFLNVDKNGISLIGYGTGADMAAVVAASYPAYFPNTTLVSPTKYNEMILDSAFHALGTPHKAEGGNKNTVQNLTMTMPMQIWAAVEDDATAVKYADKWNEINTHALTLVKDPSFEKALAKAEIKVGDPTPEQIVEFARGNVRVLGYSGGTIRTRIDYDAPNSGFTTVTERLEEGGLVRRWRVYKPAGLPENPAMVVVLHGSSSAINDIEDESLWHEVADTEKFIVLYLQGYPSASEPRRTGSPWGAAFPKWNDDPEGTDIAYIKAATLKVAEENDVDLGKIYLTGHSNGAMMTAGVMVSDIADMFAAYAPIGMLYAPSRFADTECNDIVTPVWAHLGEFDMQPAGFGGKDSPTPFGVQGGAAAELWAERFSISTATKPSKETTEEGKYGTYTWKRGEAPLVKYTVVNDSTHIYIAGQSVMIWDWFDHFSRDTATKALKYDTTAIPFTPAST